jgi:hypothetical protein
VRVYPSNMLGSAFVDMHVNVYIFKTFFASRIKYNFQLFVAHYCVVD